MVLLWDSLASVLRPQNLIDMAFSWTEWVYDAKSTPLAFFLLCYGCWLLCCRYFLLNCELLPQNMLKYTDTEILKEYFEYNIQERLYETLSQRRKFRTCQAHTLLRVCLLIFWLALWLTWPAAEADAYSGAQVVSLKLPSRDSQPELQYLPFV